MSTGDENITLRNEGGVVVATIQGGSFHEEKKILATLEKLGGIIDSRANVQMVLDLNAVEYLSSAGLGRLVALLKKAMAGGGSMYLANVQPEIRELFEVMRLDQIFKMYDSVDAGTAAFA